MDLLFLTRRGGAIVGPIANLFGYILNFLYDLLDNVGIINVGITIILFTIIAKLLLTPLTIKQQRFTRANSKMQPEMKKIQEKYKGKNDKENQAKYQKELNELYAKHKTSPLGGCLPILVQFPIIIAMYTVVSKLPAYISKIYVMYEGIIAKITSTEGYQSIISPIFEKLGKSVGEFDFSNTDNFIDVLSSFKPEHWNMLTSSIPAVSENVDKISHINKFLGINLTNNPGFVWPAILIPIGAAFFSWLQIKTVSSTKPTLGEKDTAAQTAQTMNLMMPFMSGIFAVFMPAGLGLYWIISSIISAIQQILINKYLDKNEFNESTMNIKKEIQKKNTINKK